MSWLFVTTLLLSALPVAAQFAPASLPFPSTLSLAGAYNYTGAGSVGLQYDDFQMDSATHAFLAGNSYMERKEATYAYTKTGVAAATFTYVSNWYNWLGSLQGTVNSTALLTFTSGSAGTFTSSGTYNDVQTGNGTFTGSGTFSLNTAPTISSIADISINKNATTGPIAFTVGDAQTDPGSLSVTRASSNTNLVPLANVVLGGSGANRSVTITPAADQSGTSTITLIVSDGVLTAYDTFVLTVTDGQTLAGWRQANFSSSANSGDGADLNDFDHDGLVNLLEFALGSLPKSAASANRPVTGIETFGGQAYLTMTISKPPGISGITYLVEVSGALTGWSSGAANTTVITDDATTLKVRDNTPVAGGCRFIRLKVTAP